MSLLRDFLVEESSCDWRLDQAVGVEPLWASRRMSEESRVRGKRESSMLPSRIFLSTGLSWS